MTHPGPRITPTQFDALALLHGPEVRIFASDPDDSQQTWVYVIDPELGILTSEERVRMRGVILQTLTRNEFLVPVSPEIHRRISRRTTSPNLLWAPTPKAALVLEQKGFRTSRLPPTRKGDDEDLRKAQQHLDTCLQRTKEKYEAYEQATKTLQEHLKNADQVPYHPDLQTLRTSQRKLATPEYQTQVMNDAHRHLDTWARCRSKFYAASQAEQQARLDYVHLLPWLSSDGEFTS